MDGIKWMLIVLGTVLLCAIIASAYGAKRWASRTQSLFARLEASRVMPAPTRYAAAVELPGLPAPVQRYFRTVLIDGQPIVTAATVAHRGTFNMGEAADQWRPFTSSQRVVTQSPGFVWDGRVSMLPGVAVHVHDAYVGGEGILNPSILGLFPLIDLRGRGEVARGELMRFFAEAAWYPTALLPSQEVRWEALDDSSARATLVDGPLLLTLTFRFGADGLMTAARAEARGRMVGGTVVPTPWEGRWSNYQRRSGMLVPMTGEVSWVTAEGPKPYWRGTVETLHYEFAP